MSPGDKAAMALLGQYGDDAEVIAMLRAAEYAAMGDVDGLASGTRSLRTWPGFRTVPCPISSTEDQAAPSWAFRWRRRRVRMCSV